MNSSTCSQSNRKEARYRSKFERNGLYYISSEHSDLRIAEYVAGTAVVESGKT
jgi:hypothetical protein